MEDANTLNVHIHSLRDKLAKVAGQRPYPKIETVWGLGYRLEVTRHEATFTVFLAFFLLPHSSPSC